MYYMLSRLKSYKAVSSSVLFLSFWTSRYFLSAENDTLKNITRSQNRAPRALYSSLTQSVFVY